MFKSLTKYGERIKTEICMHWLDRLTKIERLTFYYFYFYTIHWFRISPFWCALSIVAGALGLPAVIGAAGFGAGGIGAGGLVAFLQSLGVSGLASFVMTQAGQALIAVGCLTELPEEDEWMKPTNCHVTRVTKSQIITSIFYFTQFLHLFFDLFAIDL